MSTTEDNDGVRFALVDGEEVCFISAEHEDEFMVDALAWQVDELWRSDPDNAAALQDIIDTFPAATPQDLWCAFFGTVPDAEGHLPPSRLSARIWQLPDTAAALQLLVFEFPQATLREWGQAFAAIGGNDEGPFPPSWRRPTLQ